MSYCYSTQGAQINGLGSPAIGCRNFEAMGGISQNMFLYYFQYVLCPSTASFDFTQEMHYQEKIILACPIFHVFVEP